MKTTTTLDKFLEELLDYLYNFKNLNIWFDVIEDFEFNPQTHEYVITVRNLDRNKIHDIHVNAEDVSEYIYVCD